MPEESKSENDPVNQARGDPSNLIKDVSVQNFIQIAGAAPGNGVKADTKLIKDSMWNFMEQYDKGTLTVEFPKIIQNLQGSDAQIEVI